MAGESTFNFRYQIWSLAGIFIHMLGLLIAWRNVQDITYWVFFSAALYVALFKIITHSLPKLPWMFGYANWVSLIRLLGVHILLLFHQSSHDLMLLFGFLSILLLDGLDGFLARKFDQETEEGAALDNETDALMAMFLTWIHVSENRIPEWILIPGGLRYLYVWIIHFIPVSKANELLPRKIRASISVIFFISLLFPFVFHTPGVRILISVTGALIVISFLLSISLRITSVRKGH